MAGTTDAGRPQDQGRRHRRRAEPSPATTELRERWYARLRDELEAVIAELTPAPGLLPDQPTRPPLERRRSLVELGTKIAAALGAEVDPGPPPDPDEKGRRRRPPPVKFE